MKKYLLILGILLVGVSCRKAIAIPEGITFYFENPQPIHDSELSKIPNKFRGLYMDSDSTYVRINQNIILTESFNRYRFHKNTMDSLKQEFEFINGKYILKLNNSVYEPKIIGDSIELSTKYIDTFFLFSSTQKAKLLHGQLVLNTKDSIYGTVKTIRLEKNKLSIKYLYSEEDLNRMDSITKIKSTMIDSSTYILKPTRSEFVKCIKLKHFGYDQEYLKVK